jgi:hypothetical protein
MFGFIIVLSSLFVFIVAQRNTATVDLSIRRGFSKRLASNFIYGIPDNPNHIPDHFYQNIGFNYARTGGAQLGAPSRGWIHGTAEYQGRLQSSLSNYRTARKYGAKVLLLPHDVWGTDSSNSTTSWPGDGGDWSDYDRFVRQLMVDMKRNNALEGLIWEIWNEPDITVFWKRSMEQWVQLYTRTHKIIRCVWGIAMALNILTKWKMTQIRPSFQ